MMKNSILFKVWALAGVILLASHGWGFETDKNSVIRGDLSVEGNTTLGDASSDTTTIKGKLLIDSVVNSDGIITSEEQFANSDEKIPTAKAVKKYSANHQIIATADLSFTKQCRSGATSQCNMTAGSVRSNVMEIGLTFKGSATVGDITHCSHSFSFSGGDNDMVVVADSIDYGNASYKFIVKRVGNGQFAETTGNIVVTCYGPS